MSQQGSPPAAKSSSSQKRSFSQRVTPSTSDAAAASAFWGAVDEAIETKKPKALFTEGSHGPYTFRYSTINRESSPLTLSVTQPLDYTPVSQTDEPTVTTYFLAPADSNQHIVLSSDTSTFTMGRSRLCSIVLTHKSVSNHHANLTFDLRTHAFFIEPCNPYKPVYIWNGTKFEKHSTKQRIRVGEPFRLLPPLRQAADKQMTELIPVNQSVQFTLGVHQTIGNQLTPGSASFDDEYLKLLRRMDCSPNNLQTNKKGANWTLAESHTLIVDLQSADDESLLPLSTLRKIYFMPCLIEALWYLRGEDTIAFLQRNNCHFWNAQAQTDGFIGYNYGLLTNFPGKGNQLETNVIRPLCQGKSSRNMVCSLVSGEHTLQEACTTSVQFCRDGNLLHLTVNQRSSDIVLGLPNDVVVWTIILHLVRREVKLRTGLQLLAGKLSFVVSAGGAHVYCINKDNYDELLMRTPIERVQPYLLGPNTDTLLADLVQHYDRKTKSYGLRLFGYGDDQHHPAMKISQATELLAG